MSVFSYQQTTLGECLPKASDWPEDTDLLLPFGEPWRLDTPCLVAVCDPYSEDDPEIEIDKMLFKSTLQKEDVEDILHNSQAQLETVTPEQALRAFLYYFENDAFIDWLRP